MGCPYALIRYDTEKEEPVKDSRGFCIEVPRGEPVKCKHLTLPQPLICYLFTSTVFRGNWTVGGKDWKKNALQRLCQEPAADREEEAEGRVCERRSIL